MKYLIFYKLSQARRRSDPRARGFLVDARPRNEDEARPRNEDETAEGDHDNDKTGVNPRENARPEEKVSGRKEKQREVDLPRLILS
jgi:hypothetical protein